VEPRKEVFLIDFYGGHDALLKLYRACGAYFHIEFCDEVYIAGAS